MSRDVGRFYADVWLAPLASHGPCTRLLFCSSYPVTQVTESYTSAGGDRQWETFYFTEPRVISTMYLTAQGGPDIAGYPALKFGDLEVIGEPVKEEDTVIVSPSINVPPRPPRGEAKRLATTRPARGVKHAAQGVQVSERPRPGAHRSRSIPSFFVSRIVRTVSILRP